MSVLGGEGGRKRVGGLWSILLGGDGVRELEGVVGGQWLP